MFTTSAFDVLLKEDSNPSIRTSNEELDNSLGHGISLGLITEFCGKPGTGKTQMCLQLCVNIQIPQEFGGLNGTAVFIDTKHGFTLDRYEELCEGMLKKIQQHSLEKFQKIAENFKIETLLDSLHYSYVSTYIELIAAVHMLKHLIVANNNIKLIIIDSFSFLFRNLDTNKFDRLKILYEMLTNLQILADKHNLAVVITNEITTQFDSNEISNPPALGESHLHKITERILLSKKMYQYQAEIVKSLYRPNKIVSFTIAKNGIA